MRELFLCSVCKKDVDNTHDEKICYDNQRGKEIKEAIRGKA